MTLWENRDKLDQLLNDNDVVDVDDIFDSGAAAYALDSQGDRHYWTQFAGLLMQRTFGHIDLERVGPGRRYCFHCRIAGEDRNLDQRFEMDLDSDGPEIPRIPLPLDDAEFVQVNIAPTLEPNQEQRVSITVRNTGVTAWTADDYELRAVGTSPWRIDQVRLPGRTEPGEQVTFRFTLRAPRSSGDFDFDWQMGRRFGQPFGAASPHRTIEVKRPESTDDNPSTECDDIAKELEAERQTLRGLQALLTNVNASGTGPIVNPGPIGPPGGTGGGFGGGPRGGIQGGSRGGIGGGPSGDQKADIIQEIEQQKAIISGLVARQRRLGCI